MGRGEPDTDGTAKALARIKAGKERLRRKEIALLRAQLAKAQERVDALQRQLRALGDQEATRSAGRIDWTNIFERLGPTFAAKELVELTGVSPRHAAVITHRWRRDGLVRSSSKRGVFRKLTRGR